MIFRNFPAVLTCLICLCGVISLCLGEDRSYSVLVVDPPITNQAIISGEPLPKVCRKGDVLQLKACAGEYEPASFVVVTKQPLESVRIEIDALNGDAGRIDKDRVNVRIAKPTSPRFPLDKQSSAVLLVNDDSIFRSEPDPLPESPEQRKDVYPNGVRDAKELLPVRVENLKQFWITVHVPDDAKPGLYTGVVRIIPKYAPPVELTLQLEVYAFKLLPPLAEYSIYYGTTLVTDGSDDWRTEKGWSNTAWLPPQQYLIELQNMVAHGLTNPFTYTGPQQKPDGTLDFTKVEAVLALREKAGMVRGQPLYLYAPQSAEAVQRSLTEPEKKERSRVVREVMDWAQARGYPNVYFYGIDEASGSAMAAERDSFQAIRDGGGKVFVACSGDFYDLVADQLDQPVLLANLYDRGGVFIEQLSVTPHPNMIPMTDKAGRTKAKAQLDAQYESLLSFEYMRNPHFRGIIDGTHRRGNRIFTYMFPMAGVPMPEIHRRHYGLGLWQMGFDGCMNWAYTHMKGSVTEPGLFWCYVVRAHEGVIDKLEWEGFREGVDDARYLATLLDLLNRRAGIYGKDPLVVETWAWLGQLDAAKDDLNATRAEMAKRILALKGMGVHKKAMVEIDAEKLIGAPKDEKWEVEFTGDGLPTEQGWTGDANGSMFSPNYPPGFLLTNGNPGGSFKRPLSGYTKVTGWTLEWGLTAKNLQQLPSTQTVVTFSDDASVLRIDCSKDSMIVMDHTGKPLSRLALQLDEYHIYRLVRRPGSKTVELYIDNKSKPSLSVTPAAPPAVGAGNLNSVWWGNSLFQGVWDYFRYHKGAAIPNSARE